jgi:hypothetical protein
LATNLQFAGLNAAELYEKYASELADLAAKLQQVYFRMQSHDYGTTFGDVEGELLYMLVRETRPPNVFEISPDCGWSTNYLLAALSANQDGILHSFEIEPRKRGRPARDVILGNQHSDWDTRRLEIHLGDAVQNVPLVGGAIHALLIDSCHESWFAEWYTREVFPRVEGFAFVQDIAFVDELEPSSEASFFWRWAMDSRIDLNLVGPLELSPVIRPLRSRLAERRRLRSNSVVLQLPNPGSSSLPELGTSPKVMIAQAVQSAESNPEGALDLLTEASLTLAKEDNRSTGYRELFRLGEAFRRLGQTQEAERQFRRALGNAVSRDHSGRAKSLAELALRFARAGCPGFALQCMILLPFSGRNWLGAVWRTLQTALGRRSREGNGPK